MHPISELAKGTSCKSPAWWPGWNLCCWCDSMIPSDRLYTFAALRPFLAARVPCNYTAPVARERRTYKRWLLESRGKRRALTFERQGSRSRFLFALRLVLSFAFSLDSYTQRALRFPLILFFFCGRWFGKEKVPGLTFSSAPVTHPSPLRRWRNIFGICV